MVFKKKTKKKAVKKVVEEPTEVEEEFDEEEFEEEEEEEADEEEELEAPTPTGTPAQVAKAPAPKMMKAQSKHKDIWTVETIATETGTVIRNNQTGEDYDATKALVKILNYLEE